MAVSTQPLEEDVKETFLSTLKESLRTTLAVFDFKDQSLEQMTDKTLLMDKTQAGNNMSMLSLHKSLPTTEEIKI
mgnify:CR=1 FL=1